MNEAKSKKRIWLWAIPAVVVIAIVALLATNMAQASLDDSNAARSDDYVADMNLSSLSVALVENSATVAATKEGNAKEGAVTEAYTNLLAGINDGNPINAFGKKYEYNLAAQNDGSQDEYVRVVVNRYWKKADGSKATTLSPEFIGLQFDEANWIVAGPEQTGVPEQYILYSKNPIGVDSSLPFLTHVSIDPAILDEADFVSVKGTDDKYVTKEYDYADYKMAMDVEVSAVQTHNGADAIKSAWGVDVSNVQGMYQSMAMVD